MSVVFPFQYPQSTVLYLSLYLITLVLHIAFMNYVFAGSAWLLSSSLKNLRQKKSDPPSPHIREILRDWLPFALSMAITLGIAPLLFVQILYKQNFYTANLLLFHRWMSIVPVLIIAFYLLYLKKSRRVSLWPTWGRLGLNLVVFGCFAFTGYTWTENHLLSTKPELWTQFYASNQIFFRDAQLIPRLALWLTGSLPTLGTILAAQLRFSSQRGAAWNPTEFSKVRRMALAGLAGSGLAGLAFWHSLMPKEEAALTQPEMKPWIVLALLGLIAQGAFWIGSLRSAPKQKPSSLWMNGLLSALGITLLATACLRESIRLSRVDITLLTKAHDDAALVGGLPTFLVFFAINALLIAWLWRRVQRRPL